MLHRLGLKQPASGIARNMSQARAEVAKVGFPALVRPSFVLGGRAMEICYDAAQFERFVAEAFVVAGGQPVLIDRFLEDAIEVDVDAIADGQQVIVAGIMEHIEEAGVHSGDSACACRRFSLPTAVVEEIRQATVALAQRLQVQRPDERAIRRQARRRHAGGLRAGGESAGQPHRALRVEGHRHAAGQGGGQGDGGRLAGRAGLFPRASAPQQYSVKEAVFPFAKFAGIDVILGPEMKSTGEVMGVSENFPIAFAKSQLAAGTVLPIERQGLYQR